MADLTLDRLKHTHNAAQGQIAPESYRGNRTLDHGIMATHRTDNNPMQYLQDEPVFDDTLRDTLEQARAFVNRYDIIDTQPEDASGFSAVALRDVATPGRVVIAVRSAEVILDKPRDITTDLQVGLSGFSHEQIQSMHHFMNHVQAKIAPDAKIQVVGYSFSSNVTRTLAALYQDPLSDLTTRIPGRPYTWLPGDGASRK